MNTLNTSLKNLAAKKGLNIEPSKEVISKKAVELELKPIQQPIKTTVEVIKPKPIELIKEPEDMATWLQKGIAAVKKVAKPLTTTAINAAGGLIGVPTLGTAITSSQQAKKSVATVKAPEKGATAVKQAVKNVENNRTMEQQQTQPTMASKIMENVKKNWMYYAIGAGALFAVWYLFGKKKVASRRRR